MLQALERSSVSSNESTDEIQAFATIHRLKARTDADGTKIIPGKLGHIYQYGDGVLGVMVMPDPPRRQYWGCLRSALLKAGFTVVQDGDGEGAAIFEPANTAQAKAAVRAAGIKHKRRIAAEQRTKQIERLRASAGRAPSAAGTRQKPPDDAEALELEIPVSCPHNRSRREGEVQW